MPGAVLLSLSHLFYGVIPWLPLDRGVAVALFFAFQSLLWFWVWRQRVFSRWLWVCFLVSVVLARGTTPLFEDDYFRYFWDGWQTLTGGDPFAHAPLHAPVAPALEPLRRWINFPELVSFYPPAIQWVFAGLVGLGLEGFLWALALGAWVGVYHLGRGRARWLWLLQHPLLVREWFQAGHYDGWLALALLGLATHRSPFVRGVFLSLGAGIKAVTLGLVPVLREKRERGYFMGLATGLLVSLPLLPAFFQSAATWREFSLAWEMNSGLFRWVRNALWMGMDFESASAWARGVVGVGWLGCLAWIRPRWDRPTRVFWAIYLLILLSPVVNPWYVTWVLPLVAFLPRLQQAPLLLSWSVLGMAYLFYRPQLDTLEFWWNVEHVVLWVGVGAALYPFPRYHFFRVRGETPNRR